MGARRQAVLAISAIAAVVVAIWAVSAALAVGATGGVAGTVRDGSGSTPIAGLTVTLVDNSSTQRTTTTDGSGHYAFSSLPVGKSPYHLKIAQNSVPVTWAPRVWQHAYYDFSAATDINVSDSTTQSADATMAAASTIEGTVHRWGHPEITISGVNTGVTWQSEALARAWSQSTGSDGTFSFAGLAPGTWLFTASDPSGTYGSASVNASIRTLADGTTDTIDVALPIIPVTTSDAHGGWYSASGLLSLTATGDILPLATKVSVDGGPASAYAGPFLPAGEGTKMIAWASIDASGNAETTHTATIHIDRTPPVSASDADGGAHAALSITATDNLSGVAGIRFQLDGSAPATYTVPITLRGGVHTVHYWAVDVAGNVESAHDGVIDNPSGTLQGMVRRTGTGAALGGISVGLYAPSGSPSTPPTLVRSLGPTLANGSYAATGVVAGEYLVRFTDPGNTYSPQWYPARALLANATTLTVADGVTYTLDATLTQPGTISGAVTRTGTSAPLSGLPATLTLHELSASQSFAATTDPSGDVLFPNLPSGDYALAVDGSSADCVSSRIPTAPGTYAHLDSGQSVGYAFALDPLGPADLEVTVHRLGGDTAPLPGALVTAFELSGTGITTTTVADENGVASFPGMVPGTWRFSASQPGYGAGFSPSADAGIGTVVHAFGTLFADVALPLLPSTSANVDGSTWYAGPKHVTLTATPGDLAVTQTRYALAGVGATYVPATGFDIALQGVTTLGFASIDASGNAEETQSVDVHVDSTPPTTTPTITTGGAAQLSLAAVDTLSGVRATFYRIDSGATTTYTVPVVTSVAGTHPVEFWSTDVAGNTETHHFANVINSQAPQGGISGVVRDSAGVSPLAGISVMAFDSAWNAVGAPVTTSANGSFGFSHLLVSSGPYHLRFTPVSQPSTWAPRYWRTATYDRTASTGITVSDLATVSADATLAAVGGASGTAHRLGHPGVTISGVSLGLSWASEATGPVLATTSGSDGTFAFAGLAPGTWHFTATDPTHAYGPATISGSSVSVSSGATSALDVAMPLMPTTSFSPKVGWYNASEALTFVADGDLTPLVTTVWVNGTPQTYLAPFLPATEGALTVQWRSADASGNVETTHTATVHVDRTPPTTTSDADGGSHSTLTLSATDNLSGVDGIRYWLDGSGPTTYTVPVPVGGGRHTVAYQAVDEAGNWEPLHTGGTVDNPSGTIRGAVRRPGTGAGIFSIRVDLYSVPATGEAPVFVRAVGPTGADGTYEATDVTAGQYLVRFSDNAGAFSPQWFPGRALAANAVTVTVPSGGSVTANATMTVPGQFTGDVHAAGSGALLGGVPVTLELQEGTAVETRQVISGEDDGSFAFSGLPAGQYALVADGTGVGYLATRSPSNPSSFYTLTSGRTIPVSIALAPLGAVTIDVTATHLGSGTPIAGATITAMEVSGSGASDTRSTDASGHAGFSQLLPGTWRLVASAPGYLSAALPNSDPTSGTPLALFGSWNTTISLALAPSTSASVDGRWYAGTQHVTLNATPGDRPLGFTRYALDGVDQGAYAGAFDISKQGSTRLDFASVDASGGAEATHTIYVHIDNTRPVTTALASPGPKATVSLSATDALSGVASTHFRLDGGADTTYTVPVVTSSAGMHSIEYWSVDSAGNVEVHKTLAFKNTPAVLFSALSSPGSVKHGAKFTVSGYISPKQKAGTKTTKLLAYRKVGNDWVLKKTFTTASKISGGRSKFSASISLPNAGTWKLVAHSPGYGGYWQADSDGRIVTVR